MATWWLASEGSSHLFLGQKWGALRVESRGDVAQPRAFPAEVAQAGRWASSVTLQGGDGAFCPSVPLGPAQPGPASAHLPS